MMDESVNAGMEIKTDNPVFENQFVGETPQVTKVCLKRTPQGLMRDDENGKEISSVFEILEPGDYVNHQTVLKASSEGVELQYFDNINHITTDTDVFSVLLKDEVEEWIKNIKQIDVNKIFENLEDEESVNLFRLLELTCLKINMEFCKYLYVTHSEKIDERLAVMVASSLRRPFVDTQTDLGGKGVVTFSVNYNKDEIEEAKKDIESRNGKFLYNVSMFNPNNLEVNEGDYIVIC